MVTVGSDADAAVHTGDSDDAQDMDIDNRQDVRRYQDAPDALDIQAQEDVISAAPTYTREPPQGSTPGSVFKCKSDAACCNTVMMCDPCSSGTKPCESAPGRWSAMRLHTLVSPTWVMKGLLSANPPHTSSLLPLAKVEVLVPAPSCPGSASTLDVARIGFELAGAPSGHFGSVAIEGCVTNACVVQDQLVESKTSSLLVISVKGKESYYPFYLHTKTGQNTLFGVDWMTTWWGAPRILVRLDHSMGQGITIHDNTQTLVPIRLHKMPSTDLSATKASQIHLISMIPSQLCMDRSTVAGASHCLSDHPVHVFSPGASKDAILASPSYFGAHSYYPEEDAAALDSGVIAVLGRDDETNCQRDFCSPVFEGASTSIHIWDPTTNVAKIHELADELRDNFNLRLHSTGTSFMVLDFKHYAAYSDKGNLLWLKKAPEPADGTLWEHRALADGSVLLVRVILKLLDDTSSPIHTCPPNAGPPRIEKIAPDGTVLWTWKLDDPTVCGVINGFFEQDGVIHALGAMTPLSMNSVWTWHLRLDSATGKELCEGEMPGKK